MIMILPMCTNAISTFPMSTICDAPRWICIAAHLPVQILIHTCQVMWMLVLEKCWGPFWLSMMYQSDGVESGKLKIRRFLWMPISLLYFFILISQSLDIQNPSKSIDTIRGIARSSFKDLALITLIDSSQLDSFTICFIWNEASQLKRMPSWDLATKY